MWITAVPSPTGMKDKLAPCVSPRLPVLHSLAGPRHLCGAQGHSDGIQGRTVATARAVAGEDRCRSFLLPLHSRSLTLLPFSFPCRGPGVDFHGGQAFKYSYC